MSTFHPRAPYTPEELQKLYPKDLQLQLVQILLRHGERSPVAPRFRNTGLPAHWPYCTAAQRLTSVLLSDTDTSQWDDLKWRRRLEIMGEDDVPAIATGPGKTYDGICQPGELSDKGRETTLALGQRLRHLYVDQLGFMPSTISDSDMIYIRSTPIPRALESVQQAFWGLYPSYTRPANFPPPTIITRSPADETLYPNDSVCRRFAELARAYANRTALKWNDTDEMKYLDKKIGKWMPDGLKVAVDSRPRLSGTMDTVNATLAHGPETRMPKEFYDPKLLDIMTRIVTEEWYQGYNESQEYRMLGIGGLLGDVVARMAGHAEKNKSFSVLEVGGEGKNVGAGRGGEQEIKLGLSGCHDTTIAATLASLGCFDGEPWPFFTSHIAIELFRKKSLEPLAGHPQTKMGELTTSKGWWSSLFGGASAISASGIGRRPLEELSPTEKQRLEGFYVRIRYNDRIMTVPGCKPMGKHLEGDESFCTMEAFKSVVDKFTPKDWKTACFSNRGEPPFPETVQPSGY